MATKKTGQDQDSALVNAEEVAPGDVGQAAVGAPASAAPSQSGAPSPSTTAVDATAAPGSAQELPGYLVTDVSCVLHDGTWYHQGDEVFLNDKDAVPLLNRRIIKPLRSEK
ncbi:MULTISPECIES: hypothetical protein [unclassified Pseudomonas]|uniref:hypothetical protein n=1 Tax=unclassified Pseudomonas TaxID=196821 RepID=UPI000AD54678|nr:MULTISPECIES: hypothetical protein [unclassified Pseudomonas]QIH08926.1 hypothetical protein ATY02_20400 [Pseudomonas sp. BIOMIG1BAC]